MKFGKRLIMSLCCVGLIVSYGTIYSEEKKSNIAKNATNIEESKVESEVESEVGIKVELDMEGAKQLLTEYNNKVDYIYQGTEKEFNSLSAEGYKGFVFLPDVDGDMGYFVDSTYGTIYSYHPDGYMEELN